MINNLINNDLTPEDVSKGNERVFHDPVFNDKVVVATPTFFKVPKNAQQQLAPKLGFVPKQLNVLKFFYTTDKCPWGTGLKCYVLEHGVTLLCRSDGFMWFM